MKSSIYEIMTKYYEDWVSMRHELHQHPELSGEEVETSKLICRWLDKMGISYRNHISGEGVVAIIEGEGSGDNRTVAIRADMDALPIEEENCNEYCSVQGGKMHACGHDFHIVTMLGALTILQEMKSTFSGTIKAIFQPSEEEYEGGAKFMIADGVLEQPRPDVIFGIHADPLYESGTIAFHSGPFMASTDEIHIQIIGKGGHAALLSETVNPIIIASKWLTAMYEELDKMHLPENRFVLNFGRFIGAGSTNVVPDKVEIAGTLRLFDEVLRDKVIQKIKEFTMEYSRAQGGDCVVDIRRGYPMLRNNETITQWAFSEAQKYLGDTHVVEAPLRFTAEDFSYYLEQIPGTFIRVGVKNTERGITHNLHTSRFDVDDEAIRTSSGIISYLTMQYMLQSQQLKKTYNE